VLARAGSAAAGVVVAAVTKASPAATARARARLHVRVRAVLGINSVIVVPLVVEVTMMTTAAFCYIREIPTTDP
jgi:hypothetical protein